MFLLKPSSFRQLLLALAIALFSLMVVASPVGISSGPKSDKFDIQFGRKQTGSDAWLPNSVAFAKDQKFILFIGKHLLRFQASPKPHIIHEEQITLPPKDRCILLGPKRQTQLALTIAPDEAKDFWALMVDLPELKKKVGWSIKDDSSYNLAVRDVLIRDPKWGRLNNEQMKEWIDIDLIQLGLREKQPLEMLPPSAMPLP
ncbi:hypothetical protein DFJ43DRAFT_1152574 [Lentinula guzmanii]|uniref:Uncharacterized protein n=1 Tax=Lentinula guzmanii TaxID=2804957 RepID=A0AA38JFF9_9AGAR|nr:hypothetical protein DFJ43DRAFT_1152574 [Lentinula guzmanii]